MEVSLGKYTCTFAPWHPRLGRVFERYAFDSETTLIDAERPDRTPHYVIGAACDGRRGVFLVPEHVPAFLAAHRGVPLVAHHAVFDLRVLDQLLKPALDVYERVDANQIWDTEILHRLVCLATAGHTARGSSSLAHCAQAYLGVALDKHREDAQGRQVRTNFGQFRGKPASAIPADYLQYLGADALATWHVFEALGDHLRRILNQPATIFGHGGLDWLRDVVARFGPLTHHIQLRASIVMDVLSANGIQIDPARRQEKGQEVAQLMAGCRDRLRRRGYLVGEPGGDRALQSILAEIQRQHPTIRLPRTSTEKWSVKREDLAELQGLDPFVADLLTYRSAEKLLSTYLGKMGRDRVHPRFDYLLETGRTCCSGLNLQNLPKENDAQAGVQTIRGCFVPARDAVFIDADYSQIELAVLGHVLRHQLGLGSALADLINSGQDVHRLIAAKVLDKPPASVSEAERDSIKPVSFGRPGGMGVSGLQRFARSTYGMALSEEDVGQRIDAYHQLVPGLTPFLDDEVDVGAVLARTLNLTESAYRQAQGKAPGTDRQSSEEHPGWLGWMLLKTLTEPAPCSRGGRPYSAEELDYFWTAALGLLPTLEARLHGQLRGRQPSRALANAVRDHAGRRSVFTLTGRLRAGTTFCSARNTLFQGPAADGAVLGLWAVWRAGYRLVDFVHDQLVVECANTPALSTHIAKVEELMKEGMAQVIPDVLVKVKTVVTKSLNKADHIPATAADRAGQRAVA